MKLVVVGGHLSPALAIIEALPKDIRVLFIGRRFSFEGDKALSLEYKTISSQKIPFASISAGRLQRKFTKYTIFSLLKIPYGIVQSFSILRVFKPDVVLGFGGFLSLPVIFSAYILRIPIVVHEQTFEAGLANRIASFFAKKICISWESSREFFPKNKTVLTGNPLRKFEIRSANWRTKFEIINKNQNLPVIYITGGSSGSHFINTLVEGCIEELLKQFILIHQTGDAQEYHDFDRLNNIRESLPSMLKTRYMLTKFINPQDIGSVLQKAKLVVGRAGINTITELIYFNKPATLIPISFGQNNEQLKNALFFKGLGLGEAKDQNSLDSTKFLQKVKEMYNNINKYKINKEKFSISNTNAAQKIIETLEYVTKSEKD